VPDKLRKILVWVVTLGLTGVVAWGFVAGEPSETDRVFALGARIKCPVCQGEAISESPSDTAVAMMNVVGDGIRLDPRFELRTMLLWLLPAAAFIGGGFLIWTRRRPAEVAS